MNNQESLFEEANKNTKQILEKIIVYKNNMIDELNFIAKQAIMSAKVELAMAQAEGIPYDRCSALAQQLLRNPDLKLDKQFKVVELVESSAECEENKAKNVGVGYKDAEATYCDYGTYKEENEDDLRLYIREEDVAVKDDASVKSDKRKNHSQSRRTWLALQSIKTDECEIKIEVARLTQNDQKSKEKVLQPRTTKSTCKTNACTCEMER